MLSWKDFPRKKDILAVVGYAPTTRDMTPWDNPDVEVIGLNEAHDFPWMKRFDRWFQIHPRWDFTRNTNNNDPNHFLWLQNVEGKCKQCAGGGKVRALLVKGQPEVVCPACQGTGWYKPTPTRQGDFPIYMQKHHDDIPNSVPFPLDEISAALIPAINWQKDYFTSSFSLIAGLAFLMGYPRIEFYGFEMAGSTEYGYQRANAEYIIGLLQGKGIEVYIPRESEIRSGPLYAYKSMKQGYRQNLELRYRFLVQQLGNEQGEFNSLLGQMQAIENLLAMEEKDRNLKGILANLESDREKKLGLLNGLQFAIKETENLTKMYDNYFWMGTEGGEEDIIRPQEEVTQHITLNYKVKND